MTKYLTHRNQNRCEPGFTGSRTRGVSLAAQLVWILHQLPDSKSRSQSYCARREENGGRAVSRPRTEPKDKTVQPMADSPKCVSIKSALHLLFEVGEVRFFIYIFKLLGGLAMATAMESRLPAAMRLVGNTYHKELRKEHGGIKVMRKKQHREEDYEL